MPVECGRTREGGRALRARQFVLQTATRAVRSLARGLRGRYCAVMCDVSAMFSPVPTSLPVPEVEREQFARPPLRAMLGQVQFPPVLRLSTAEGLAPLHEEVAETFPEVSEERQLTVQMGAQASLQPAATRSFRFTSADQAWSLIIAPGAITVEASADQYTSYEAFRERFALAWGAALRHVRPSRRVQQGLRYIDHIERALPASEWGRYVNGALLGILAQPDFAASVQSSLTDLRFTLGEGQLSFKHGLVQAGPENAWGYLLDFDYFTTEPSGDVSAESVLEQFDAFHDALHGFFRWCVTDEALSEFRGAD
jgi:uncharacterized protein (TIGR04255 family)